MERTNMRYMTEDDIDEKASFVSIDVSFIFIDQDSSSGISNFEYGRRSCCTDQTAV